MFDDERKIERRQNGAEWVALGDAVVAAVDVGRGESVPKIRSGAIVEKIGDER